MNNKIRRIKKAIKEYVVAFVAAIVIFTAYWLICFDENTYKKVGEITEINGNEIVFVDAQGEEWAFYGDGYSIGDHIKVTFTKENHEIILATIQK